MFFNNLLREELGYVLAITTVDKFWKVTVITCDHYDLAGSRHSLS